MVRFKVVFVDFVSSIFSISFDNLSHQQQQVSPIAITTKICNYKKHLCVHFHLSNRVVVVVV